MNTLKIKNIHDTGRSSTWDKESVSMYYVVFAGRKWLTEGSLYISYSSTCSNLYLLFWWQRDGVPIIGLFGVFLLIIENPLLIPSSNMMAMEAAIADDDIPV